MIPSRHFLRLVAVVGVCASVSTLACSEDDGPNDNEPPSLSLYAFPASVAPNAETTIAVVVRGDCATLKNCNLKVGLTPASANADPGLLFQPGLSAEPRPLLDITLDASTNASDKEPLSLVYRAPSAEGSRVVAASLFNAAGKIIATRTISVSVTKLSAPTTDAGGATSSNAAKDAGNDGTTGTTDTGAPDAIADAGGQ